MKTIVRLLAFWFVLSIHAFGATYYFSYSSGSDSNNCTSTATPCKHGPWMKALTPAGVSTGDICTGTCASITPTAGDKLILKGGDVWPYTTAPWDMSALNGSSSTTTFGCTGAGCIYVGNAVDAGLPAWNSGTVTAITIDRDYGGWTSAPSVSCSGGGGSGATATTTIMPTGQEANIAGHLLSITVTNGGSGYTSAPTCTLVGSGSANIKVSIDYAQVDWGMSSGVIWHLGDYPTSTVYAPGFYIGSYTRASGIELRNMMAYETTSGFEGAFFGILGSHSTGNDMFVHNMGVSCASTGACSSSLMNNTEWLALLGSVYDELSYSTVGNGDFIYVGTATTQANNDCINGVACTFGTGIGTSAGGTYPISIHHNRSYANSWLIRAYGGVASSSDYPYLIYNNDVWLAMAVINPTSHINRMYSNPNSANPPAVIFFNNYDHNHWSGSSNQMGCHQGVSYYFFNNVSFQVGTGTDAAFGLEDGSSGNGACLTYAYNNTWYDTNFNQCVNGAAMPQATTAILQNNQCLSASAANPFYGNNTNLTFTNYAGSSVQANVQAANVEQAYGTSGYVASNFLTPQNSSAATVAFASAGGTANLTSLCSTTVKGFSLAPLCSDINGNPRPAAGGWQAGAYQLSHSYYVDYASGLDTNSGTSPSTPWQHAPEMPGCAVGSACHITLQPGDRVIFKGGVSWTGTDSFTWVITASGSTGFPIYYGVDQNYYDTTKCQQVLGVTITNAGSAYSVSNPPTPVFTAGTGSGATGYTLLNSSGGVAGVVMTNRGTGYSGAFTVTFSSGVAQGTAIVNSGWCRPIFDGGHINYGTSSGYNTFIYARGNNLTFDNFEEINQSAGSATISQSMNQLIAGNGSNFSTNDIFENIYAHHWDVSFCFGTGNIAPGSSTITGFVPTSGQCTQDILNGLAANNLPATPIQEFPQGLTGRWPVQNSAPITGIITGANPYQIVTNSSAVATACNNCLLEIGGAGGAAPQSFMYGDAAGNIGSFVMNSVIDGKDTLPVQINPYPDCGFSEGLNTPCIAPSLVAAWRGGNGWVNNTIQYIDNGSVGGCGVVAGNTIQYIRIGTNPTGHTNIWESIAPLGDFAPTGCLMYNNLWWHTTMQNPNGPNGQMSVGLSIEPAPAPGQTAYLFNNVFSDTITNTTIEPAGTGGNMIQFNNTMDCGAAWSLSEPCTGPPGSTGTTTVLNNLYITTAGSPYSGGAVSNPSPLTEISWTSQNASTYGYSLNTTYIYAPQTNNCGGHVPCTIGTGASIASYCTTLTSLYPPAGAACAKDTTYGALYDPIHNTSVANARTPLNRSTGTPDVGAFQFNATLPPQAYSFTPSVGDSFVFFPTFSGLPSTLFQYHGTRQ